MIAVVVFLFAAFWLPIHIFQLWYKFDRYFPKNNITYYYKIFAHTLSYANSCVNPFVYAFLSDGFRKGVRKAFPWWHRMQREASNVPARSSFNSRNADAANGESSTFAISGLRRFLSQRKDATATRLAHALEPSGVYIGVPTDETPRALVPRPECAVVFNNRNTKCEVTYLESDI